jgi:hypothetical protein
MVKERFALLPTGTWPNDRLPLNAMILVCVEEAALGVVGDEEEEHVATERPTANKKTRRLKNDVTNVGLPFNLMYWRGRNSSST